MASAPRRRGSPWCRSRPPWSAAPTATASARTVAWRRSWDRWDFPAAAAALGRPCPCPAPVQERLRSRSGGRPESGGLSWPHSIRQSGGGKGEQCVGRNWLMTLSSQAQARASPEATFHPQGDDALLLLARECGEVAC